jgi:NADH:ubiquinone oxidoreductase subunit 4 (subunit M)
MWGGPNRVYAAFKFFLYTLLGSLLTLIAILYLERAFARDFFRLLKLEKNTKMRKKKVFSLFLGNN